MPSERCSDGICVFTAGCSRTGGRLSDTMRIPRANRRHEAG
ncbi:TPA: hypothetical protein ACFP4U_000777 [Neisseria lactamica]|uniref:Uncharacterized protein n=1 Tax=Neisseria lactamica ATCC 23970 TaxID=546265 RepID=D0WB27_NEILA|nr:hypothetical protein [Neisseria lactamica]EEZ75194.1 hypothetical protein NEILACOT_04751 [Neisseria lactamica ATCC 23970]